MNDITIEPIVFKEKNLWELKIKDEYIFASTIEEVLQLIKENKLTLDYTVKDKYIPGENATNSLDNIALKNNIIINYTNENHYVALSNTFPTFINPDFLKKYEKEIKNAFIEQIKNSNKTIYTIDNYIFSDEIFNILLEKENITIYFKDINLTKEQIDKLNEKFINAYLKKDGKNKQISSKYAYDYYTKEKLQEMDSLTIYSIDIIEKNNILNLKYLKENAIIIFSFFDINITEEEQLTIIQEELKKLNTLNKKFIIKFQVKKRSIYNKLFKNLNLDNLDFIINNDLYDYSIEEYQKEDAKLDNFVSEIKNSSLSPFEKFIAVYNIVKNIKPYKENQENKDYSRYLRYIINNEYIVCVGYAKLLVELLDKVGINANEYSVGVDISYDDGFTLEEKLTEYGGHARVIVSMDDDKYDIHGLFISDPTWDNNLDKNYFNNALLPFDSMQQANRIFYYSKYNPVLDIHNFKEYNEQINYLLKRVLKSQSDYSINQNNSFHQKITNAYIEVANNILNTIICDPKYDYFIKKISTCHVEKDFIDFYTELGHYLLNRINHKIDEKSIFKANKEVLQTLYKDSDIEKIDKETQDDYYKRLPLEFPYTISDNSDFNLEDRKTL